MMTIETKATTNVLNGKAEFRSLKPINLSQCTKSDLLEYFENSYNIYETLFSSLNDDEAYRHCPDRLRLPLIFYYGHTAVVYMNKLVLADLVHPDERIDLHKEVIFETGVDEMSWDDIEHYRMGGDYDWPTVAATKEYRRRVKELIHKVIDRTPLELPITQESPWWGMVMGMEHDRIHYETSSVLIRQYPVHMVHKPDLWRYGPMKTSGDIVENQLVVVSACDVTVGKRDDFPSFGWDNEYGELNVHVTDFVVSKFKITNEDFLEFVLSGGYEQRDYWSSEAWEMVCFKEAKHPLWWRCPRECKNGCGTSLAATSHCQASRFSADELVAYEEFEHQRTSGNYSAEYLQGARTRRDPSGASTKFPFKFRVMFDDVEMPFNWPVEINYHEAKAFCKWKTTKEGAETPYRLISEAEHHAMRDSDVHDVEASSDIIFRDNTPVNHNLKVGSSTPIDFYPANDKGLHDVFGNVWEWCEDHFNGLRSQTHYMYDDFSTPCYDGRHTMIMGGSWASTGDEASHFARFMFRRHFHQHCGFRLARSLPTSDGSKANPQFRFVEDRIYLIDGSLPNTLVDLDMYKMEVAFYPTTNKQYLYDSHLHPELFEEELRREYFSAPEHDICSLLIAQIERFTQTCNTSRERVVHLGSSTGRVSFELTKLFDNVISLDYSSRFLEFCRKMQQEENVQIELSATSDTEKTQTRVMLNNDIHKERVNFVQFTWIAQEVPPSQCVLFNMIDRVMNAKSWLVRMREIVKPSGVLIIHSRESKFNGSVLLKVIGKDFSLLKELRITQDDSLTIWEKKQRITI